MKWFLRYWCLEFWQDFVKICNFVPNFFIIFSFSEFNDHYWPTKLCKSRRWVTWQNFRDKKILLIFLLRSWKRFLKFCLLQFYDLFINKVRKLDVAVTNPIMGDVAVGFSLSVRVPFLLFVVHVLSLLLSLSLSLSLFLLIRHFSCCYVA